MVPTRPPAARRLLVVDDEEPIRFGLELYFTAQGYAVDCAAERDEALQLLADRPYDLMFADLRLSGAGPGDGLEVVHFARSTRPQMRIVVLTAYGSPETEERARALGADAFYAKPKPLPDLARIADGLLAG